MVYVNRGLRHLGAAEDEPAVNAYTFTDLEQMKPLLSKLVEVLKRRDRAEISKFIKNELKPLQNKELSQELIKSDHKVGNCGVANANIVWHFALAAREMKKNADCSFVQAYKNTRPEYKKMRLNDRANAFDELMTNSEAEAYRQDALEQMMIKMAKKESKGKEIIPILLNSLYKIDPNAVKGLLKDLYKTNELNINEATRKRWISACNDLLNAKEKYVPTKPMSDRLSEIINKMAEVDSEGQETIPFLLNSLYKIDPKMLRTLLNDLCEFKYDIYMSTQLRWAKACVAILDEKEGYEVEKDSLLDLSMKNWEAITNPKLTFTQRFKYIEDNPQAVNLLSKRELSRYTYKASEATFAYLSMTSLKILFQGLHYDRNGFIDKLTVQQIAGLVQDNTLRLKELPQQKIVAYCNYCKDKLIETFHPDIKSEVVHRLLQELGKITELSKPHQLALIMEQAKGIFSSLKKSEPEVYEAAEKSFECLSAAVKAGARVYTGPLKISQASSTQTFFSSSPPSSTVEENPGIVAKSSKLS